MEGRFHVQHLVMIYLKLNSSKEREWPCPKESYFLFLGLDPRARFNQQCKYKLPATVPPRYFQQQKLLNTEVTSTIRDSAHPDSFGHFDESSAF